MQAKPLFRTAQDSPASDEPLADVFFRGGSSPWRTDAQEETFDEGDVPPAWKRTRFDLSSDDDVPLASVAYRPSQERSIWHAQGAEQPLDLLEDAVENLSPSPRQARTPQRTRVTFAVSDHGGSTPSMPAVLLPIGDDDVDSPDQSGNPTTSSDDKSGVLMALIVKRNRIGCAVFDEGSGTLFLLEDKEINAMNNTFRSEMHALNADEVASDEQYVSDVKPESHVNDLVSLLIDQHRPGAILASSACPEEVLSAVKKDVEARDASLEVRPARDFNAEAGKLRLLTAGLLDVKHDDAPDAPSGANALGIECESSAEMGEQNLFAAHLRLNARIDISGMMLTAGAASALLASITRALSRHELPGEEISAPLRAIEVLRLDQMMHITAATQRALGVFLQESVASAQGRSKKEGVSLFSILDWTVSALGGALLRRWIHYPLTGLPEITGRHDAVACLLSPQNAADVALLVAELKHGATNMPQLFEASFVRGEPTKRAWQTLGRFAEHACNLRQLLLGLASRCNTTDQIAAAIHEDEMRRLVDLTLIIDWEESAREGAVFVRAGYDRDLDNKRRLYAGLPSFLSRVARELQNESLQIYAEEFHCVYFPQLGFLIAMPLAEGEQPGDAAARDIEGLSFKFASNTMTYWKSSEMEDLDGHFGDLHTDIEDRQIEILTEMHQQVLQHQKSIIVGAEAMAHLDALLSLARAAQEYGYIRPTMTTENVIRITAGRHPLSERCLDSFVPNDTALRGGKSTAEDSEHSMIVVTGPNASGKSVYIKSIALTVLMAQCGSFVPAAQAELGVCDKLLTSISVTETVSKLQSNFMIDVSQVALALRQATDRSLVLLDETARGTDSVDGAALFAAIIEDLLSRGWAQPKVAVATHFHEVFYNGLLPPLVFTPKHMQIVIDRAGDDEELVFLFKAVSGFAESSFAGNCAELYGVDRSIVERAHYITSLSLAGRAAKLAFEGLEDDVDDPFADNATHSEAITGATKRVAGPCGVDKEALLAREEVMRRFIEWDIRGAIDAVESEEGGEEEGMVCAVREGLARCLEGI